MIEHIVILYTKDSARAEHVQEKIRENSYLPFRIIEAVTPDTLENFIIENRLVIGRGKYEHARFACYMSHLKALEIITKENLPEAVILEDDFSLVYNYAKRIHAVTGELPQNYDLVKLWYSKDHFSIPLIEGKKYIGKQLAPWGDVAYLVSRKGAGIISEAMRRAITHNVKLPSRNIKVRNRGFYPNDTLTYNMGRNRRIVSFNVVKPIVETEGGFLKVKGTLESNLENCNDYYIHP